MPVFSGQRQTPGMVYIYTGTLRRKQGGNNVLSCRVQLYMDVFDRKMVAADIKVLTGICVIWDNQLILCFVYHFLLIEKKN